MGRVQASSEVVRKSVLLGSQLIYKSQIKFLLKGTEAIKYSNKLIK